MFRGLDFVMMVIRNAKGRDADEWGKLIAEADGSCKVSSN
jgi:hypothetical protein